MQANGDTPMNWIELKSVLERAKRKCILSPDVERVLAGLVSVERHIPANLESVIHGVLAEGLPTGCSGNPPVDPQYNTKAAIIAGLIGSQPSKS